MWGELRSEGPPTKVRRGLSYREWVPLGFGLFAVKKE